MTLVVDASVAACWFAAEAETPAANRLLRAGATLIAPALILAEVANVAWKKLRSGEMALEQALAAPREIRRFINEFAALEGLAAPALDLARQIDHPVYDCIYIELARQRAATLVTLDRRLIAALRSTPLARHIAHLADWRA